MNRRHVSFFTAFVPSAVVESKSSAIAPVCKRLKPTKQSLLRNKFLCARGQELRTHKLEKQRRRAPDHLLLPLQPSGPPRTQTLVPSVAS